MIKAPSSPKSNHSLPTGVVNRFTVPTGWKVKKKSMSIFCQVTSGIHWKIFATFNFSYASLQGSKLIVNYNKSEMHKSCKKKHTVAYSSPPLHSRKILFFFYWKPATPPPLYHWMTFSLKKISVLGIEYEYSFEPRYNEQFGTCEFLLSEAWNMH